MSQYRSHLDDIINLTRARLDLEDLNECIETKIPSEKYIQLLEFLDQVRQNYSLEHIVLVRPIRENGNYDVVQVA